MLTTLGEVHGEVAPRYSRVADAFARNLAEHGDVGAAFCLYECGEPVVDIWGGLADPRSGRPWARDTLALWFSITKAATAICVLRLVERGVLDLDQPVARYWPEFAANGKEHVTVRQALSHRAAVAHLETPLTREQIYAWEPVARAIADQAPNWKLGDGWGYHPRTWGWLVGELIRRVDGRGIGRYFADEVAGPLGLEFWIGLPEQEEHRVARLLPQLDPPETYLDGDSLKNLVMTGPSKQFLYADEGLWNSRAFYAAEIPSSNGIGDARSVARMLAATIGEIGDVRLLGPEILEEATRVHSQGMDLVLRRDYYRVGLGLHRSPGIGLHVGERAFGHPGQSGSMAWADPDRGLAYAYVPNQMIAATSPAGHVRSAGLTKAVYESQGG
jgi:CubicO group peptidase (beta-lactamase class C family)